MMAFVQTLLGQPENYGALCYVLVKRVAPKIGFILALANTKKQT